MNNSDYLYRELSVPKAVATMAVPTVISQLISMIYNMADTFFIGQLNDPNQVAAVSIAAPLALTLTALANLLGIGGASMFSRALGSQDPEKAKKVSVFSFYGSLVLGLLVSIALWLFPVPILSLLGADDTTMPYAREYILWVTTLGAIPSLMSMVMAHFVRADGAAKLAGYTLSAGGILNLILDPIFILDFGLGLGICGAAVATLMSNIFTFAVFISYYISHKKSSSLSFSPAKLSLSPQVSMGVLAAGLPGMLQTLLASLSNAVLNNLASAFGGTAIAALGIVKKLDQLPMSVTIGIAQGIVPLIGYNHADKNYDRVKKVLNFAVLLAVGFSLICVCIYEIFAPFLVRIFIDDAATILMGTPILQIMCISTPLMAVAFVIISVFQSTGKNCQATILSVIRKGIVDIPLMLLLGSIIPLKGLAFVQPITEALAMATAITFYVRNKRSSYILQSSLKGQ